MARTVGYMITWTTYGTWLQGDAKGFVADGEVRGENPANKGGETNRTSQTVTTAPFQK